MITRLFKEAEDSIKVAEYLRENGVYQPITIDVDYNENTEHRSHKQIPMVKGWILGLGFSMNTKQNVQGRTPLLLIIFYEFSKQFTPCPYHQRGLRDH